MLKKVLLLLVLVTVFGCQAYKPEVTIIDPGGRQMPYPSYTLASTGQAPIYVTYYMAKMTEKNDLDGTITYTPTFLATEEEDIIDTSIYTKSTIFVEVFNPNKIEYNIWKDMDTKYKSGKASNSKDAVGKSDQKYRSFSIDLPVDKELLSVECRLELFEEGERQYSPTMIFGGFKYRIR